MTRSIAVLGGTGDLGSGLAFRWARAGYDVNLGSRDPARAAGVADGMNARIGGRPVRAMTYRAAAQEADIAVLAVPFALQSEVLTALEDALRGKVMIDCTVPLMPPKVGTVRLPSAGSAARTAQTILGNDVRVVSAFQNVSAVLLQGHQPIDCDVLVCADDADARALGIELVAAAGLRGIEAGPLDNAAAAEALTSLLITINRRYKSKHAGIRITGLPEIA